jgi:hypothetical protein
MKNESIIIEASQRGVSAVTVRVPREHRERGIALLAKAMHSIAQLDKDLRATGRQIDHE